MSQIDLFADPEPVAVETEPEVTQEQPPAIVKVGASLPPNALGLKPLCYIPQDWHEVMITDAEFDAERAVHATHVSDQRVMLHMLEQRGIRTKPCTDDALSYLYDYIDGCATIRKRTVPGFTITCRQEPTQDTQ